MKQRNLVSIADYSKDEILELLHSAAEFEATDIGRESSRHSVFRTEYAHTTKF